MHQIVVQHLEEYLAGAPPQIQRAVDAHLESCEQCSVEMQGMRDVSTLFEFFKAPEPLEAAPGFYARLSGQLGGQRRISFWNIFSLDPTFGRRVVFASLMTLAVLGSILVSQETSYSSAPTAEYVMAQTATAQQSGDRERMLVTLASYEP